AYNEIRPTTKATDDQKYLSACYAAATKHNPGVAVRGFLYYSFTPTSTSGSWALAGHVPTNIGKISKALELYRYGTNALDARAWKLWYNTYRKVGYYGMVRFTGSDYASAVYNVCHYTPSGGVVGLYGGTDAPAGTLTVVRAKAVAAQLNKCLPKS